MSKAIKYDLTVEEDVETFVTEVVIPKLGKPGRMLPSGKNVRFNVAVTTSALGYSTPFQLWYGDLTDKEISSLSDRLGIPVTVVDLQ